MAAPVQASSLADRVNNLVSDDLGTVTETGSELTAAVVDGDFQPADVLALARSLTRVLGMSGPGAQARIVLLLGILTEKGGPEVATEIGGALGTYLDLLAYPAPPLRLALMYLLAHFPNHRDRILSAVQASKSENDYDISRLDRILRQPDFTDPATADQAGRSWPSPAFLAVTDDELSATAAARRALPSDQVAASWDADTLALLAYSGGLAVAGGA